MNDEEMDYSDVLHRIDSIRESSDEADYESAHDQEDGLMKDFIRYVADNASGEMCLMAEKILEVQDMNFPRWYA